MVRLLLRKPVLLAIIVGLPLVLPVLCHFGLRHDNFRPNALPYRFPTTVDYRNQPLITAVASGDHRRAKELLSGGISFNSRYTEDDDPSRWFLPFHLACQTGDVEMAKILVEAGADPDAVDFRGETAIAHMAGELRFTAGKAQVLGYLAKVGANFNAIASSTSGAYNAIQRAVLLDNLPMAKALIEFGANVNASDPNGNTALHFACNRIPEESPNPAMIQLLLKHGADPRIKNKNSKTPADYLKERHLDSLLNCTNEPKVGVAKPSVR